MKFIPVFVCACVCVVPPPRATMCLWHWPLACGWLAGSSPLLPEVESLAQEVHVRERNRELQPSVPLHRTFAGGAKRKKKKNTVQAGFLEKTVVCLYILEPSRAHCPGLKRRRLPLVIKPEECGGGIQFQAFHFCAHCEGQTLTGTISLPSPRLPSFSVSPPLR